MSVAKSFDIPKKLIWNAYLRVKANGGAPGVDGQTIEEFERNLKDNLYRLWNRMSSGTYFPAPVLRVAISKRSGGTRNLGIPTVADRIAQTAVKMVLEPVVDPLFHSDSYGYRPGRSAVQAVGRARERCWKFNWAIDLDIRSFFGAPGQAWRFQRVQFPPRQGERAAPPGIEPCAHGGDDMGEA